MKIVDRHVLTPEYSLGNAHHAAQLCQLSYPARHEVFDRWRVRVFDTLFDAGYTESFCFDQQGTQCYLAEHPQYQVLVFRGSEELQDWLDNLCVQRNQRDVHAGFWAALSRVLHVLEQALLSSEKPLYLAGHSQGAALAVLLVDYLRQSVPAFAFRRLQGVYGFGCPRVGGSEFQARYPLGERTWLHINNTDLVPRVPFVYPEWLRQRVLRLPGINRWLPLLSRFPGGYRHVGQVRYFGCQGSYSEQPSWQFRLTDILLGLLQDVGQLGLDVFEDHYVFSYVHAVQRVLRSTLSESSDRS